MRNINHYWCLAGTLSTNLFQQSKLFVVLLLVPLRKKIIGRHPMPVIIRNQGSQLKVFLRDGADIAAFIEVFVEKEYEFAYPSEMQRIIDIGAHIGAATIYYATMFPQANVYAYEADPENYNVLVKNTDMLDNVFCIPQAVSGAEGRVPFFHNTESSIGSSLVKKNNRTKTIDVESTTLEKALYRVDSAGLVDIVKFDVEGAEYEIFSAVHESLQNVRVFIGELHSDLIPVSERTFFNLFKDMNFKIDKIPINRHRSIVTVKRI